jgi:hypothetical protein
LARHDGSGVAHCDDLGIEGKASVYRSREFDATIIASGAQELGRPYPHYSGERCGYSSDKRLLTNIAPASIIAVVDRDSTRVSFRAIRPLA